MEGVPLPTDQGVGEHRQLLQQGLWQSPGLKTISVFSKRHRYLSLHRRPCVYCVGLRLPSLRAWA